jgi:hypothetical protein
VSETGADPNVYGFRHYRSTADAVAECFNVLSRKSSAKWVLEGDIKSCFDEIDHDWLLKSIPTDTQVLKKWLRCGYMDKGRMTWRWATRRHPNKNAAWVKHKYYTTQGNNNWVFFGQEYSKKQSLYLFSPTTVSIERHVKIKSEANPYDPTFAAYFSNRRRHGSSSPSPSVIEKVLA